MFLKYEELLTRKQIPKTNYYCKVITFALDVLCTFSWNR